MLKRKVEQASILHKLMTEIFQFGSLSFVLLFQLIFRLGFWILYSSLKCWCAVYIKVWDAFWKKNSRHLKTNINKKKTNRILSWMKKKSNFVDPQMAVIFWSAELAYLANWRFTKNRPNGETQHLFFQWLNSFDVQCNKNSNYETFFQKVRL